MRHQDLTINHRLESWVYANAAARTGATGFVAGDVGRISYQTDTGQYWRLTAITPTWAAIVIPPVYASLQTGQGSPAATSSAAGVMAGLGNAPLNARITPTATGKILITITGQITNNGVAAASAVITFGTGTAPVNGAANTGTQVGGLAYRAGGWTANITTPFSLTAAITAVVGTQIWIDLLFGSNGTSGTITLAQVCVTAVELP